MGIYLGQLPPAEIARLKAELAETLIANFCYPRFFDHRTETLQMRPVDRTKRQEVWMYLSSVDFTAWNRVDLMSVDFQHQIERLFIQFVQRNRSFFGEQGRRRMFDIRIQISSCAVNVVQGLRNHLTGQKQNTPPFGSPRPVISWSTAAISGRAEPTWEQISSSTMTLQQQLQELRGEVRVPATPAANEGNSRALPSSPSQGAPASGPDRMKAGGSSAGGPVSAGYPVSSTPGLPAPSVRRVAASVPATPAASAPSVSGVRSEYDLNAVSHQPTMSIPPVSPRSVQPQAEPKSTPASQLQNQSATASASPASQTYRAPVSSRDSGVSAISRQNRTLQSDEAVNTAGPAGPSQRKIDGTYGRGADSATPPATEMPAASVAAAPQPVTTSSVTTGSGVDVAAAGREPTSPLGRMVPAPSSTSTSVNGSVPASSAAALPRRTSPQPAMPATTSTASGAGPRDMMAIGEDDTAIFEQLRHQLVVWLRVEAITAGLEISNQSPTQLLELLRQQAHMDETRLQVVSTLLNLANQVIKTGLVSVLDYKQALMFHLMHTRRQ